MDSLDTVAPAFVDMAHSIVWATGATVNRAGEPVTRILHPIWEWDGDDARADGSPPRRCRPRPSTSNACR